MRQSINELATDIVKRCEDPDFTADEKRLAAESWIEWFLDDVFKIVKNINETSLDRMDRAKRIIEMEQKFGIPKTHLI